MSEPSIEMFNGLVFAAFVWGLAPMGPVSTPLPIWTNQPYPVQILAILRTTAKTSRLPNPTSFHSCPEPDGGRD